MVVGHPFEQHFATIEPHTELRRELHPANAELIAILVGHCALRVEKRHRSGIKMGMVAIPQLRILQANRIKPILKGAAPTIEAHASIHHRSSRSIQHLQTRLERTTLPCRHFGLHDNRSLVRRHMRCRNIERVARKVEQRIGDDQFHPTKQSASGVPSRVVRLARIGAHGQQILLSIAQTICKVYLKTDVAIIRTANAFAIQIDIAHIHNAAKVDQHTSIAPRRIGRKPFPIPPDAHLFEAAATQPAPPISSLIGCDGLLLGRRRNPGLTNLKIVG